MKDDFVMPILVLTLICLLVSAALSVTNNVTAPIITTAEAGRAEAARYEMIPEADDFEGIVAEGLPATIREAYKSTNDVGYVFMVTAKGYGGDMVIICAIDADGKMIRCHALEISETKGLGSKVSEAPFEDQFIGIDSRLEGISGITGATISTNAYLGAIRDAFAAFGIVSGS